MRWRSDVAPGVGGGGEVLLRTALPERKRRRLHRLVETRKATVRIMKSSSRLTPAVENGPFLQLLHYDGVFLQ